MTSKIRIKMGQIEVEYEGSEQFLKKELHELLEAVSKLHRESGEEAEVEADSENEASRKKTKSSGKLSGSTTTFASKLGCNDGPGLIIAAAAYLTFDQKMESFSRLELLKAAKSAKSYYKKTISNNLSGTLARLVKEQALVENSTGTYALNAAKMKELEAACA